MSVQFNDTSTYKGLVQIYEKEIGANRGDVSGDTNKLKEFTADVNLAIDDATKLAIEASGTWQWDDSNQTDYPFIKTNIVSSQRDYAFTTDGSSNIILDIQRVAILTSSTSTSYTDINPVDVQSEDGLAAVFNNSTTGIPSGYDKTGNAIIFDTIPNYSATNGLLAYVNREASYFTSSDTTKKPGFPGIFHRYFAIRPAEDYARRNNLANYPALQAERMKLEMDMKAYFGRREKDVRKQLTMAPINFR